MCAKALGLFTRAKSTSQNILTHEEIPKPGEIWKKNLKAYAGNKAIFEVMINLRIYKHNLSSCEIKERNYGLCDTGAVLYQLSYQAIWELVTL